MANFGHRAGKRGCLGRALLALLLLVALVIAGLAAMRHWAKEVIQYSFTPVVPYSPPPALRPHAYADPARWFARGDAPADNPTRYRPADAPVAQPVAAAVFFIHPTSHFDRYGWNAALDNAETNTGAEMFLRALASPFGAAREIWAPRYRQATFGAFLTDRPQGARALEAAYGDVLAAFDEFMAHADPTLPIVLVGHSQGALHLKHLLRDRVAGQALARRVAAAYVVGWPVSLAHDLPRMGLPACEAADQAGCILSWQSFAEPDDVSSVLEAFARTPALDGTRRPGGPFLCVNPITGRPHSSAGPSTNAGTLMPDLTMQGARIAPGLVGAQCRDDGFLMIAPAPQIGPLVLPGNNYHVYDIPLFWANTQMDMARRVAAWHRARQTAAPELASAASPKSGGPKSKGPKSTGLNIKEWWQKWWG